MAHLRLLLAGLFVAAALAGCASSQKADLSTVYGDLATPGTLPAGLDALVTIDGNVTLIDGTHLEGRIAETGEWVDTLVFEGEPMLTSSGTMTGPEPQGGGGETTALTVAAGRAIEVRLKNADQLSGYYVTWHLVGVGNGTPPVPQPADLDFFTPLPEVGPFQVYATLAASADAATPEAIFAEPFTGQVIQKWTINGEVQPQTPPSLPVSWPTSRQDMTDIYTIELPAGATVTASTVFDGTWTPNQGTDVDIGLYAPDGTGVLCSAGALGAGSPVDPAQTTETFTAATDGPGLWSVQIGAMLDGCGGTGTYSYANAGPVPYVLTLVIS